MFVLTNLTMVPTFLLLFLAVGARGWDGYNGRDTTFNGYDHSDTTKLLTAATTSTPKTSSAVATKVETSTKVSQSTTTSTKTAAGNQVTTKNHPSSTFFQHVVNSADSIFDEIEKTESNIFNFTLQCGFTSNASITIKTSSMELHIVSSNTTNRIQSLTENTIVAAPVDPFHVNENYLVSAGFLNFSSDESEIIRKDENLKPSSILKSQQIRISPHISVNIYRNKTRHRVSAPVEFSVKSGVMEGVLKEVRPTSGTRLVVDAKIQCTFINMKTKTYSSFGCKETVNRNFVSCYCNHTTIFAVLLSVTYIEIPPGVKVTSLVVESISVTSLAITSLILIKLRKRIRNDRTFVQINLSSSLLFLHVFNLSHDYAKQNNVSCQIVATFIHFFMLASSVWMMLEGITLVLKTTNQSMMFTTQHQQKLNGFRFAIGWGIPAVVVSVALVIGYTRDIYMDKLELPTNGYVIYKRCWLAPKMLIYSVMVPIGFVLLANTAILVKVAYFVHLKSSQANRFKPAVKRRQSFVNYEDVSATLKAVLTLLPVLGLPWIVSFLVGFGESPSIVLIYINVLVNGLQGLFLFLLYCINSRVVRKLIVRKTIAGSLNRPSGAATSVSAATALSQFRNGSNATTASVVGQ